MPHTQHHPLSARLRVSDAWCITARGRAQAQRVSAPLVCIAGAHTVVRQARDAYLAARPARMPYFCPSVPANASLHASPGSTGRRCHMHLLAGLVVRNGVSVRKLAAILRQTCVTFAACIVPDRLATVPATKPRVACAHPAAPPAQHALLHHRGGVSTLRDSNSRALHHAQSPPRGAGSIQVWMTTLRTACGHESTLACEQERQAASATVGA